MQVLKNDLIAGAVLAEQLVDKKTTLKSRQFDHAHTSHHACHNIDLSSRYQSIKAQTNASPIHVAPQEHHPISNHTLPEPTG